MKKQTTIITKIQHTAVAFLLGVLVFALGGCQKPEEYRTEADKIAAEVIMQKQIDAIGKHYPIRIERPSTILRRRLIKEQKLPYAGPESLGTDQLEKIAHWPEPDYPTWQENPLDPVVVLEPNKPVKLTLNEALQIGAQNSFDYQNNKENIFEAALDLDLTANDFRLQFTDNRLRTDFDRDMTGDDNVNSTETSADLSLKRKFENGATATFGITMAIANLLTPDGNSSFGSSADTSINIPLLRGSGKHIVTESLTQAQRKVVYRIYDFERFKKTYAVSVASSYLKVLGQLDSVKNSEENYRMLVTSAIFARRRADAGLVKEIDVDRAAQNELSARNNWISAVENHKGALDSFKNLLGLPIDANIELDRLELNGLTERVEVFLSKMQDEKTQDEEGFSADSEVVLVGADMENTGPLEIDELAAIELAFENRLDLRKSQGEVYDSQRNIVVLADRLRAELTIGGSARVGGSGENKIRTDKGIYSAFLTFDPAFERTAERNNYRKAYISLEKTVRRTQSLEDSIKSSVRNKLRNLLKTRQTVHIQTKSVKLAEKRVSSVSLFLEAGRAPILDLLDAQESLLGAQNALTSAIVNYRIAELELQRDMGVLVVNEKGLWHEYTPETL
ncbi:MAG: TolC family protein [Planctomycetes bacterium]|nr:TolC family protein [Planctomycetota bacterium]